MKFSERRITIDTTEAERLRHALGMSIRSPGLNPQNVFALLVAILKQQFPEDTPKYAREFRAYVQARPPEGLGMDPKELVKLVGEFRHPHEVGEHKQQTTVDEMVWMRKRVERLLLGTSGKPGDNRFMEDRVAIGHSTSSNSRARILARLDRAHEKDGPHPEYTELATKVRAREMSARAAAIEAGFKRDDPARFTCPECGSELPKFRCPGCGAEVWGGPDLAAVCDRCKLQFRKVQR